MGVGWLLPKVAGDLTPPPHFAPLAAWHYHEYPPPGVCIWEDGTLNPLDAPSCASQGGTHWHESPWMLHAWIFRPNAAGVFGLFNSAVETNPVRGLSPPS